MKCFALIAVLAAVFLLAGCAGGGTTPAAPPAGEIVARAVVPIEADAA
jgi:uncharacterized lipoprotein YajG